MGFERITYKLDFSETRWAGLEARARGTTIEEAIDLQRYLDMGVQLLEKSEEGEEHRRGYLALLAEILVSWNRTDDGEPVPIDEKHLRREEFPMLQALTHAYLRKAFEVDSPLSRPSSDGVPSVEQFQLMDQLSGSLPS